MQKITFIILLTIFLFLLTGCEQKSMQMMKEADAMIERMENDSARKILNDIDTAGMNEREHAYYNLLQTIVSFRKYEPIKNDSVISRVVRYYEKHGTKDEVARAYMYKGEIVGELYSDNKGLSYIKKAEKLADSKNMKRDIAIQITIYNICLNNFDTAKEYAYKGLELARQTKNRRWEGACNYLLMRVYDAKNIIDSVAFHINEMEKYINAQNRNDAVLQYFYIADYYHKQGNNDKAKAVLRKAMEIKPYEPNFYLLATIYAEEGRQEEAEKMWKEALKEKRPYLKAPIMEVYSEWLHEQGRSDEAAAIAKEARKMNEEVTAQQRKDQEEAYRIQADIDAETAKMKQQQRLAWTVVVFCIAGAAGMILLLRNRKRLSRAEQSVEDMHKSLSMLEEQTRKMKEEIEEKEQLLGNYKQQMENLSEDIESKNKDKMDGMKGKIAKLQQQIRHRNKKLEDMQRLSDNISARIKAQIIRGREVYKQLEHGYRTDVKWSVKDYDACMEYLRIVMPETVAKVENSYTDASSRTRLCIVLEHIGIEKDTIINALGISSSAYRTMMSRGNNA